MHKRYRTISLIVLFFYGLGSFLLQDFWPGLLWLLFPFILLVVFFDMMWMRQQLVNRRALQLGTSKWTLWQFIVYALIGSFFIYTGLRDNLANPDGIYAHLSPQVAAGALFILAGYFKYSPYFLWVDDRRIHFGYNIGKNNWLLQQLVKVKLSGTFLFLEDPQSRMEVDLSPLSESERARLKRFLSKRLGNRLHKA